MKGNLLCLRTKVEPLNFVWKSATKKRENKNARKNWDSLQTGDNFEKKKKLTDVNNKPNLVLGGLGGFN